jgi:hypothetical protein
LARSTLLGWLGGAAIGAGSGALSGKLADYGINDEFIKSLGSTMLDLQLAQLVQHLIGGVPILVGDADQVAHVAPPDAASRLLPARHRAPIAASELSPRRPSR